MASILIRVSFFLHAVLKLKAFESPFYLHHVSVTSSSEGEGKPLAKNPSPRVERGGGEADADRRK